MLGHVPFSHIQLVEGYDPVCPICDYSIVRTLILEVTEDLCKLCVPSLEGFLPSEFIPLLPFSNLFSDLTSATITYHLLPITAFLSLKANYINNASVIIS